MNPAQGMTWRLPAVPLGRATPPSPGSGKPEGFGSPLGSGPGSELLSGGPDVSPLVGPLGAEVVPEGPEVPLGPVVVAMGPVVPLGPVVAVLPDGEVVAGPPVGPVVDGDVVGPVGPPVLGCTDEDAPGPTDTVVVALGSVVDPQLTVQVSDSVPHAAANTPMIAEV